MPIGVLWLILLAPVVGMFVVIVALDWGAALFGRDRAEQRARLGHLIQEEQARIYEDGVQRGGTPEFSRRTTELWRLATGEILHGITGHGA